MGVWLERIIVHFNVEIIRNDRALLQNMCAICLNHKNTVCSNNMKDTRHIVTGIY